MEFNHKQDEINFPSWLFFWLKILGLGSAVVIASLSGACTNSATQIKTTSAPTPIDNGLTLANASLEQSNAQGQVLWQLSAETIEYSQDHNLANTSAIAGKIWQNGEVVLEISAGRGTINRQSEEILLYDQVVIVDPRNQTTLKTNSALWQVTTELLLLPQPLKVTNPQLQVNGSQASYAPKNQRLQLQGEVVATALKPNLQLKSAEIIWQIAAKTLELPQSLQLTRYENNQVSDLVVADRGRVDLATTLASFEQNVELKSLQPKLQIASHYLDWNYQQRWATTNQPVKIVQPQRLLVTANAGAIDWQTQTVKLKNGVEALSGNQGSSDQSNSQNQLYARQLVWQMDSGTIQAQGNVIYRQNDPKMDLTGDEAVGKLEDSRIKVSSSQNTAVETQIYTLPTN